MVCVERKVVDFGKFGSLDWGEFKKLNQQLIVVFIQCFLKTIIKAEEGA